MKPRNQGRGRRGPRSTSPSPYGPEAIRRAFESRGILLTPDQVDKFWRFHALLRRENERLDLTRLHSFTSMVEKHYIDCALVARMVKLPSPLLDLGTGAGLPGIPLKIMEPGLDLVLSESRARRVEFLEEACRALGLDGVRIIPRRVTPQFTEPVNCVISRAVGSIPDILDAVRGCVQPGGQVIFMKGPRVDEELAALRPDPDFERVRVHAYAIPHTPHRRTLAIFRRTSPMRTTITIESAHNERLKRLRALLAGKGIREQGSALFAGRKVIPELIEAHADRIETCLIRGAATPPAELPPRVPILALKPELFDELDPAGTRGPVLEVRVPPLERWQPLAAEGVQILLGLQDPVNLGAAIRLGAAFGAAAAVLLAESANPYLPRAVRAAGPAVLRLPLLEGPSIREIPPGPLPLIALAADGEPLPGYRFPRDCMLLVGQEGPGIPDEAAPAVRLAIPMAPGTESINAATALAVALYAYRLVHPLPAGRVTTT